jgi:hypothetical protein
MRTHRTLWVLVTVLSLSYGCASDCLAQVATANLRTVLPNIFAEEDFSALSQGEPIVKLMSSTDRREIAVAGLVRVQVPADTFLASYQENMTRKNAAAILEIGAFTDPPSVNNLDSLTLDDRDLDDLKSCTVGDCRLKLSASMIERFQKEIDWQAPDYRLKATQLYKQMLVEYVRNYLSRGEVALIRYDDKSQTVDLNNETQQLLKNSSYRAIAGGPIRPNQQEHFSSVDHRIVWSKVKFGLKPVISINHISISKTADKVLILSKQLYANHYFESSVGLTAYFAAAGANPESYLYYENHSLLDGFGGPFGKIKRDLVEDGAIDGLKSLLSNTQAGLNAHNLNAPNAAPTSVTGNHISRRSRVGKVYLILFLIWIAALGAMIHAYGWRLWKGKRQKSALANASNPANQG